MVWLMWKKITGDLNWISYQKISFCGHKEISLFLGRGMILNVLGARRFWHVSRILPPPSWVSLEYKQKLLAGRTV